MEESTIKHLEFIQGIINRMNNNSFAIKNWMITIDSAFLALYASSNKVTYIFIAIIPTFVFWLLDSYYLQQERKFRKLYNDIIGGNENIKNFEMPINNYQVCLLGTMFSATIFCLYFMVIVGLSFGGLIIKGII